MLHYPNPELPFIVEVDASDSGVGIDPAVHQRLHLCTFFFRRLSLTEAKYDVVNRELLAVVLALQDWRHWLEGAKEQFTIYNDHKNLAYIRATKRLNSRIPPGCPAGRLLVLIDLRLRCYSGGMRPR